MLIESEKLKEAQKEKKRKEKQRGMVSAARACESERERERERKGGAYPAILAARDDSLAGRRTVASSCSRIGVVSSVVSPSPADRLGKYLYKKHHGMSNVRWG